MRSDCSRRRSAASRRSASACSSSRWPTPDAQLFNDGQTAETFLARKERIKAKGYNGNGVGGSLAVIAGFWPTPQARDGKGTDRAQLRDSNSRPLNEMTAHWPSPTALSFGDSHQPGNSRSYNRTMEMAAGLWSTPAATDAARGAHMVRSDTGAPNSNLPTNVALWSSPSVADVEGGRTSRSGDRKDEPLLNTQAKLAPSFLPALAIERLGPPSWRDRLSVLRLYRTLMSPRAPSWRRLRAWARRATRPKLNAAFVAWLMGWPAGWTSSACSATEWSLFKARMRSALSALPWPDGAPAQLSFFG